MPQGYPQGKDTSKGISPTPAISCVREPAGFTDPHGVFTTSRRIFGHCVIQCLHPADLSDPCRGRGNVRWTRGQAPAVTAQGLEWNFGNALSGPVFGFPVYRRDGRVPGRRGRRRGRDLVFLQGLARLFAASGLRAAGDDARACVRRRAARRVFQGAAALSADPGDAKTRHQRVPRGRGQEFLRAWRHRLHRHGARGRGVCAELRLQPPAAGRLDDHPAGREELPFDQRGLLHPQDQGSLAGDAHRARLFQGPHPRALSQ